MPQPESIAASAVRQLPPEALNRPDRSSGPNEASRHPAKASLRGRVFEVLEVGSTRDRLSLWFDNFFIVLVIANVVAVALETVDSVRLAYTGWFVAFEIASVAIFSVEYVLRVWSCVEKAAPVPSGSSALRARLRYMVSPLALVDLVAVLPFYFSALFGLDLRMLRVLRLLRVLKLTRYSPALNMLLAVLQEEARTLLAAFFLLAVLLTLSASGVYLLEHEVQPVDFGSIPAAMWWAIATLTTVGYGDVTPFTPGGKIFGSLITIVGIGTAALPAGILASGFVSQISRQRKVMGEEIDRALEDGHIDDHEEQMIEELRRQLGASPTLTRDILSEQTEALAAGLAQRLNAAAHPHTCPQCGASLHAGHHTDGA